MSSLGENTMPVLPNSRLIMKGAVPSDPQQQPQQPLSSRQVLGNVGNSGVNVPSLLAQKKDQQQQQHLFNQELRKEIIQQQQDVAAKAAAADFAIYTDSNSPGKTTTADTTTAPARFSGSATEDAENLPPQQQQQHGKAPLPIPHLLPSIQHGEAANQGFASHAAPFNVKSSEVVDDKNRTPFSEIIVDTPSDVKSAPATHLPTTFRELFYELPEYQADILEYLKEAEVRFRPKPDYMRKQPDINGNMRTVLVDWIVEVCEEYRLNTETLYLAVSYVDRFLSMMSVVRSKLQLVGTSAMFIASKLEEIYPPDVADFVYITDDTYTKKQVLRMEQLILRALSFDMSAPTPHAFVNLFAVMEDIPDAVRHLALYVCELSLLYSSPFLQYLPSRLAAAALAYARLLLNHEGRMWTRAMELLTGYELGHLQQVICELSAVHEKSGQMVQKAIPEKYRAVKYSEVALVEPVELTEAMFAQTYDAIAKELEAAVKEMCV